MLLIRGLTVMADHPFREYCQRIVPTEYADKLVTYIYPATGRWCLAVWESYDAGDVRELVSWPREQSPGPDERDTVLFNLRPHVVANGVRQWYRRQRDAEKQRTRVWAERQARKKDKREWLSRRLGIHKGDHPLIQTL